MFSLRYENDTNILYVEMDQNISAAEFSSSFVK